MRAYFLHRARFILVTTIGIALVLSGCTSLFNKKEG